MKKITLTLISLFLYMIFPLAEENKKLRSFSFSLGVVSTSGNTETTTVRGSIDYSYKGDTWRHYLKLSGLYGEANGEKNAERVDSWGRLERRFFPYFVFWDIDYYRNPFQGYDHSVGTGPGVGRYIFKNDKLYLSVSYYVYRIYNELSSGFTSRFTNETIERYFLHHIEERFRIKITPNLKFKQKIVYKQTSRVSQDYFITAENTLENKLIKNLSLEISYNLNYQNIPVEQTIKRLDTMFITSVKYSF